MKNIKHKHITDGLNDPFWYNIKLSKTELYYPKWFKEGIIIIADLFCTNGELLSQKDLEQFYSIKTNFLEYYRITSTVKVYLKNKKVNLKALHKPFYPNHVRILCNSSKGSQDFYSSIGA